VEEVLGWSFLQRECIPPLKQTLAAAPLIDRADCHIARWLAPLMDLFQDIREIDGLPMRASHLATELILVVLVLGTRAFVRKASAPALT